MLLIPWSWEAPEHLRLCSTQPNELMATRCQYEKVRGRACYVLTGLSDAIPSHLHLLISRSSHRAQRPVPLYTYLPAPAMALPGRTSSLPSSCECHCPSKISSYFISVRKASLVPWGFMNGPFYCALPNSTLCLTPLQPLSYWVITIFMCHVSFLNEMFLMVGSMFCLLLDPLVFPPSAWILENIPQICWICE